MNSSKVYDGIKEKLNTLLFIQNKSNLHNKRLRSILYLIDQEQSKQSKFIVSIYLNGVFITTAIPNNKKRCHKQCPIVWKTIGSYCLVADAVNCYNVEV